MRFRILPLMLCSFVSFAVTSCGGSCDGNCSEYRKLQELDDIALEEKFSSLSSDEKIGVFAWSQNSVEPSDARFYFLLLKTGAGMKDSLIAAAKNGIGSNATLQLISGINILSQRKQIVLTDDELGLLSKACVDHSASKHVCLSYVREIKKHK